MALKVDADGNVYSDGNVELKRGRGRPKGTGKPDRTLLAFSAPNNNTKELPTESQEPQTLMDFFRNTITSISEILTNGSGYDEYAATLLKRKGYDPEKIFANPQLYSNILTRLQDEIQNKATNYAEEMGIFGGLGSVGEHTARHSNWGKRIRNEDK